MKRTYNFHRIIGLLTVIPVICWTCSGLMHPFMSHWFKPVINHEFILPKALDSTKIKISLPEILRKNRIETFKNFRLVEFDNSVFFQIKNVENIPEYYNAIDGKKLEDGDKKYAEWIARYMIDDRKSHISSLTLTTGFNNVYKSVNRFLPVWKVSFDRPDGMDVMIDTQQGKMATFNNNARKRFIWIFDTFHNWSFIEKISNNNIRIIVMFTLLSIIISSAVSGLIIYGFMWKKFKSPDQINKKDILRKYHRQIGIMTAFITLTFALSGAFHVSMKFSVDDREKFSYNPVYISSSVIQSNKDLPLDWERLQNIQLAKIGRKIYYQVFYLKNEEMPAEVLYLNAENKEELKNGNLIYCKYLANKFSNLKNTDDNFQAACCDVMSDKENGEISDENLIQTKWVTRFDTEYGFVNKRLPVMKLAYDNPENTTYYIDPLTSRLAARIEKKDRIEGLSFGVLHKYFLMDWAGKDIRDIVTMISALGVLTVSLFGLALFIKKK